MQLRPKKKKALRPNHSCVSNSESPLCFIMCNAHFHIEIRLHFVCVGGRMGLWRPVTKSVCKKGQLHQFD